MTPWKNIEDLQHDPIIQEEEEPHENQANENEIEQQQEWEKEEENYITDIEIIGDKEGERNISEINESLEDIMNNSEEIDDQMSSITYDIND